MHGQIVNSTKLQGVLLGTKRTFDCDDRFSFKITGIMDTQILREMLALSHTIQQIAIEPNESELSRFKERIDADDRLKSLSFDWFQATTEAFEVKFPPFWKSV